MAHHREKRVIMKRSIRTGFLAAALAAVLVAGVGVAPASATTFSLSVSGASCTFNGSAPSPTVAKAINVSCYRVFATVRYIDQAGTTRYVNATSFTVATATAGSSMVTQRQVRASIIVTGVENTGSWHNV